MTAVIFPVKHNIAATIRRNERNRVECAEREEVAARQRAATAGAEAWRDIFLALAKATGAIIK